MSDWFKLFIECKSWWCRLLVIIIIVGSVISGTISFLGREKDVKKFGNDIVDDFLPSLTSCNDDFHGVKGKIIFPEGYEGDINKIEIGMTERNKSSKKCDYDVEIDRANFTFEVETSNCPANTDIKFFLRKGSGDYNIHDNKSKICSRGKDIKLF